MAHKGYAEVRINVRLSEEMRTKYTELCEQRETTVSAEVRRYIGQQVRKHYKELKQEGADDHQ